MKCQNCGAEFNGNYCSNCGVPASQLDPISYFETELPQNENNHLKYNIRNFEDIHFRALNKLNNKPIDYQYDGQLSVYIDTKIFRDYCLDEGLIRLSSPEEDCHLISVKECKDFLRNNNLPISGKKAELIEQISENFPHFFGHKHYILTQYGLALLKTYWDLREKTTFKHPEEIFYLRISKYEISPDEYDEFYNKLPFTPNPNDVIWGILNHRHLELMYTQQYRKMRDNYYGMSLLLEEEKDYTRSLEYLCMVLCIDLSGFNDTTYRTPKGNHLLISVVSRNIYYKREFYDPYMASNAYLLCNLPAHYYTQDEFIQIVEEVVHHKNVDLEVLK